MDAQETAAGGPITRLPMMTAQLTGMLQAARQQLAELETLRGQRFCVDEVTAARLRRAFTAQLRELDLWRHQITLWRQEPHEALTANQHAGVAALADLADQTRRAGTQALETLAALETTTTDPHRAPPCLHL